jgi:ubiquinone/menaquinone biosynthesis C-methylase UbiE
MGTMLRLNLDENLERLSLTLPLGLGRAHAKTLSSKLDRSAQSCLDVGCGRGAFKFIQSFYSVGCDIYQSSLIKAREKGYYDNLVRCDVRQLPFKPKSFDIAICVEVIEHVDKAGGMELLRQMEEIASRQVIIMTPWGYCPVNEREDNPYLFHLSGWLPQEFQKMRYKTYPFYYSRYPQGSKIHQILVRYILTLLIYPLIRLFPEKFAQVFVAMKGLC